MLIEINSLEDIKGDNYIIYLHSLTCGICSQAKIKIDTYVKKHPNISVYICIIQNTGNLKYDIEDKYNIKHESPQTIVVKEGKVIASEHHFGIQLHDDYFD